MSLKEIKNQVIQAEIEFSRVVGSVNLIAVSKVQPNERIEAVLEQGHRIFGENRIQEAQSKWPDFKEQFEGIELHIIGPLQTNKTRAAMELADCIHTLDRTKLATTMARIAQELGKCPELFVKVNTGDEPQKSGVSPKDTKAFANECLVMDSLVNDLTFLPHVNEMPSLHFILLTNIPQVCGLSDLSMGMSSDFEKAISFGATHVRVGSAIFGDRVKSPGQ